MRTPEQVVNEIHSALGDGDKQGLRNTAALLEALQAWPECPVIHVAGTNGKGSVCAMLSSVLTAAGYRTGLYTSPFLQTYRERIRINNRPVSEEMLSLYGNETLDASNKLKTEKGFLPTPFELGTALAFRIFKAEKADIIISETGMGGRLDPTNAVPKPSVCAITAIGMDHMQYLGNTLAEIAGEKAGIMKKCVPAVVYPQDTQEIMDVFTRTAAERNTPLIMLRKEQVHISEENAYGSVADYEYDGHVWKDMKISLPGEHQTLNALVALSVLEELDRQGIKTTETAVRYGLGHTFWPGRLEWCGNILMDGAHNAQGMTAFRQFTERHLKNRKKILLTGVLREKLSEEMLNVLAETAAEAVTLTPDSPRAMKAEELSRLLTQKGMKACAAKTLKEGLERALCLAGTDGAVLATGSLYFIGALRSVLGLSP